MHVTTIHPVVHASTLVRVLSAGLLSLAACTGSPAGPRGLVDIAAFQAMARESPCADLRNRLFLIDSRLVFWDRRGRCPDASYEQALFGRTVDDVLCRSQDSIAGPMEGCRDERYRAMFETVIANADRPDLGLGPAHTVHAIGF